MTRDPSRDEGCSDESLVDPLPGSPLPILDRWLSEARRTDGLRNPDALALATVDPRGEPRVRMVLARRFDADGGSLSFYTNRESPKAREIELAGRASGVFYWDGLGRQVRIDGPVERTSDADSDAYFASRHPRSQIAAWTSAQSRPIESRARLLERFEATAARFGGVDPPDPIPRPPHWGGYRLLAERIELWVDRPGRLHDRAVWSREIEPSSGDTGASATAWSTWQVQRLQP